MAFPKPLFLLIIALGFIVPAKHFLSAEELQNKNTINEQDRLVKMYGYVFDTISDAGLKLALKARMVFESLPHGSEVGIITSNDTSGYYEYYIDLQKSYTIDVRSENHAWISEKFDPPSSPDDNGIRRDFYLEPQVRENQVIRLNKLIFEQGKSSITVESFGELNKLVNLMNQNSSMIIQLEGHTDYRGSKKLNLELSQDRVRAVKDYIVSKGINSKRIKTKAYGGSQPLIKESSINASKINRRVEVRILKL